MKSIILPISKINLLKESEREVTFFEFFNDIKGFIAELLNNPIEAEPSYTLKGHGFSKNDLINLLIKRNVITRKENIDEPTDSDGKMYSRYTVSYRVPRANFKQKIKRIHQELFEN